MQTRAPSFARRSAIPRPIRLAAPVTRTILPERFGMDSFRRGLWEPAGPVGPAPEYRGGPAQRSCHGSDQPRIQGLRGDTGRRHREHHDTPLGGFDGGEDAAPVSIV